jgi:phage baseplate assembly protein W
MIGVICDWGGDLVIGATGDISTVSIQADVQQRVIRRLLTNPGDYVWHDDYGAGLGSFVGQPSSPSLIKSTILNQLLLEALVSMTPAPTVQTSQSLTGLFSATSVTVQYEVAGAPGTKSFVFGSGA